ncbi:MAG: nucleoside monophosphate kinase [Nitrospirota bacterium]
MDLIFFGMQGAGKGTLGKQVAAKYGMKVFETGGELRRLATEDSELGKKVKSIIEAGHLVSNEVVMEIVEDFMNNLPEGTNVVFDGIPRKVEQAESLNTLLDKHDREYKAVLIEIQKDTAMKRLTTRRICKSCKEVYPAAYEGENCEKCEGELVTRADDNAQAIETRIDAFIKETVPAIEMYSNKMIKIDGEPTIEEVEKAAYEVLDPILSKL